MQFFNLGVELVRLNLLYYHELAKRPCSSGLRAEHVKAVLSDRNAGNAAEALELITRFANGCTAGCLPHHIQEFLCGGRLIPLNKKDQGIRPIVVGEFLRNLVSKLALKEVESQLLALQPTQIGVGGKGPVIQAAILCVKSWLQEMQPGELLLKVDIANAYNTIDRNACLEGVKNVLPRPDAMGSLVPGRSQPSLL